MPAITPVGPQVRVRDLRKLRNWTIQELADRIAEQGVEITEAGISNVENGNKKASDRLLTAWALALGIDPVDIWHGGLRKPVERKTTRKAVA